MVGKAGSPGRKLGHMLMNDLKGHGSNEGDTFGKASKARTPDSYGKNTLVPGAKVFPSKLVS